MPAKKKKLSQEEERFCVCYVEHRNGARAVREAGFSLSSYSVEREKAHRLLTKPNILQRIAEIEEEIKSRRGVYSVEQIAEQLTAAATVDPFQYFEQIGRNLFLRDENDIPPEVARLIQKIQVTPDGIRVELMNKERALDMLAKILGAYEKDNAQKLPEKTREEKFVEGMTDDEIRKYLGI